MYLTYSFIAHLPDCPACLVVIGNLLAERRLQDTCEPSGDADHILGSRQPIELRLAAGDPVENYSDANHGAPVVDCPTATIEQGQSNQLTKPMPPEDRFRHLVTATSAVVYHTDSHGEPLTHNSSWYQFTGQTIEQVRRGGWMEAVHPEDRDTVWKVFSRAIQSNTPYELENRLRRKDGEWRYLLIRGVPIAGPDGVVREWMGYGHDITERKKLETRLLQEAFLDSLTGLYNRRFCGQGLAREIARAERTGHPLIVVCFDLDNFKRINDVYGHAAGDHVLKEFARRLARAVRGSDFAARLGGDEFMVILTECPPDKVQMVLDRILAFETVYDAHAISVSSSWGWAQHELGKTPDDLLRRADAALYTNKHSRQTLPKP